MPVCISQSSGGTIVCDLRGAPRCSARGTSFPHNSGLDWAALRYVAPIEVWRPAACALSGSCSVQVDLDPQAGDRLYRHG